MLLVDLALKGQDLNYLCDLRRMQAFALSSWPSADRLDLLGPRIKTLLVQPASWLCSSWNDLPLAIRSKILIWVPPISFRSNLQTFFLFPGGCHFESASD